MRVIHDISPYIFSNWPDVARATPRLAPHRLCLHQRVTFRASYIRSMLAPALDDYSTNRSPHLSSDMLLLREMEFSADFDGKYAGKCIVLY